MGRPLRGSPPLKKSPARSTQYCHLSHSERLAYRWASPRSTDRIRAYGTCRPPRVYAVRPRAASIARAMRCTGVGGAVSRSDTMPTQWFMTLPRRGGTARHAVRGRGMGTLPRRRTGVPSPTCCSPLPSCSPSPAITTELPDQARSPPFPWTGVRGIFPKAGRAVRPTCGSTYDLLRGTGLGRPRARSARLRPTGARAGCPGTPGGPRLLLRLQPFRLLLLPGLLPPPLPLQVRCGQHHVRGRDPGESLLSVHTPVRDGGGPDSGSRREAAGRRLLRPLAGPARFSGRSRARRLLSPDRSGPQSVASPLGVAGELRVQQSTSTPELGLPLGDTLSSRSRLGTALGGRFSRPSDRPVVHHTSMRHGASCPVVSSPGRPGGRGSATSPPTTRRPSRNRPRSAARSPAASSPAALPEC